MAGTSPPAKADLSCDSVQELVIKDIEQLKIYTYNNIEHGIIDASSPLMEIPIIDISRLKSSSPTREEEIQRLRSALTSWGCFQAINHGIESSVLDKLRDVTKQFFKLPMEEKQRWSRPADDTVGYGSDMVFSETQIRDWVDRLCLIISPQHQIKLKYWPENPETFREIVHEYATKLKLIREDILKAMARSLNLEENSFLNQLGDHGIMYQRFNFYPPCPRPDLVLGLKPHADGAALTILLQDEEVEGLQFLRDDLWVRVPVIPHALVVNVGDQVEIISNGIFKSPIHRVLTNSKWERITIATFCGSELGNEIEPIEGLINETRPRLYKKVKNYGEAFFQAYQQGKRAIDAFKI